MNIFFFSLFSIVLLSETVKNIQKALESSNDNMVKSMKNADDDGEYFTEQEIIDEYEFQYPLYVLRHRSFFP